jgi:hypothetical protein
MRNSRPIINISFALGVVFVAVSIYCFSNSHQIRQQQLQKAGDDPFVMVFTDKIQPEDTGRDNDEMIKLNNQRLRSEKTAWLLMISGVGLLISTSALKSWRRKPVALSIIEKRYRNVGRRGAV